MAEVTIQQAFETAVQAHRAGRLAEAERIYREVLGREPGHADALHLLGLIAYQVGQYDGAVELMRRAIACKPSFPEAYCNLGTALREQGQLDEAIAAYRQAIALRPNHPAALSNLGNALQEQGRFEEAAGACRQAIAVKRDYPEAHNNLGNALLATGRVDEAIAAYRQAIALKPSYPEAQHNLGNALGEKGRWDEAVAAYRQAIALKPSYSEAYSKLGEALRERGQLDEAIGACRQAMALRPNSAETHYNLGNALRDKGQFEEAIAAYRQAVALRADYHEACNNLGAVLRDRGQLEEAIAAYGQAIALKPDAAEAHYNLGNALNDQGKLDEAIAAYRQAIALKPEYYDARLNLGNSLRQKGRMDEAIAAYRGAMAVKPSHPAALNNLGNALKEKGQLEEAIAAYREAIALQPENPEAHSNLVFALHYHPGYDAQTIVEEHRRWNRQHGEPLRKLIERHANDRSPERRLRVGYISPDLREHVVGRFVLPLVEQHDHVGLEIFGYAQVAVPDGMTARLRACADVWRSLVGLSDEQAAELIRRDGIDVLVDLAGHTNNNRLFVLARKPAPVQVAWLGYPNTTGLSAMDYRLTDAWADPPGMTDALYSERLVRLPETAWCFRPTEAVAVVPRAEGAPITFGSFNNFAKVTEAMLGTWAEVLRALPGARLLLKARSLGEASVQQQVRRILNEAGVAAERVELRGWQGTYGEHLGCYGAVDIALDTFPYHGTTTTCEALWMGVPVVTLAGQTHVSRVGVSLLCNVGLAELVAREPTEYVRIAVDLAGDTSRRVELRQSLRQRMEVSPLMDAARFARHVEAAYREMWRRWCGEASVLR